MSRVSSVSIKWRICLIVLIIAGVTRPTAVFAQFKAGAGRVVITPAQSMWMAGYAARREPSAGKEHDLYAKALAIEDATGARSVIVTTDLLGLTRSISLRVAEIANRRWGLPRERLMLTASHTHCGPVLRDNLKAAYALDDTQSRLVDEYTDALPDLIAQAIGQAIDSLGPATLSFGTGHAGFATNRREYTIDGLKNGVNPIGPVDRSVPVLSVETGDDSRIVLFGYACHNTTLSYQKFCGDYAGFAQAAIESESPGTMAMFVAGCGADANPQPRGNVELAIRHGEELARSVMAVLDGGLDVKLADPIRATYREVDLELTPAPTRDELQKQAKDDNVYIRRRAAQLIERLERDGKISRTYPYPIQVWQFGDALQITALGGEVVADYALLIKHRLGARKQFVIGYANDVFAYIPSVRVLREGGYEADDSMIYYGLHGPWEPTIEKKIMDTVLELSRNAAPGIAN